MNAIDFNKERPKFFAKQLELTVVLANALIRVFSSQSTTLATQLQFQRYGQKLRTVYANSHQSFLLMIDLVLCSPICKQLSPKENTHFIGLKKLVAKKLKAISSPCSGGINLIEKAGKISKRSQKLTQFRQNNEVSIVNLKKICKALKSPNGAQIGLAMSGQQNNAILNQQEALMRLSDIILEILWNYELVSIQQIHNKIYGSNIDDSQSSKTSKNDGKQVIQVLKNPGQKANKIQKHASPVRNRSKSPRIPVGPTLISPQMTCEDFLREKYSQSSVSPKQEKSHQRLRSLKSSPQIKNEAKSERSFVSARSQSPSQRSDGGAQQRKKHNLQTDGQSSPSSKKSSNSNSTKQKAAQPKKMRNAAGVFPTVLPETIAFIVTNSLDAFANAGKQPDDVGGKGVTNINNTINIYSTQTTNLITQSEHDVVSLRSKKTTSSAQPKDSVKKSSLAKPRKQPSTKPATGQNSRKHKEILQQKQRIASKAKKDVDIVYVEDEDFKSSANQFRQQNNPRSNLKANNNALKTDYAQSHQKVIPLQQPYAQEESDIPFISSKDALTSSQKKKHNFQADHHQLIPSTQQYENQKQLQQSEFEVNPHLNSTQSRGELEESKVQVYKVSQNFLKQYKPLIQSKVSKYQVTHGNQSGVYNYQTPQVVISKTKPSIGVAQINHQDEPKKHAALSYSCYEIDPQTEQYAIQMETPQSNMSSQASLHQVTFNQASSYQKTAQVNTNAHAKFANATAIKQSLAQAIQSAAHFGGYQIGVENGVTKQDRKSDNTQCDQYKRQYVQKEPPMVQQPKNQRNTRTRQERANEKRMQQRTQASIIDEDNPFKEEEQRLDSLLLKMAGFSESDKPYQGDDTKKSNQGQKTSKSHTTDKSSPLSKASSVLTLDGIIGGDFGNLNLKQEMENLKRFEESPNKRQLMQNASMPEEEELKSPYRDRYLQEKELQLERSEEVIKQQISNDGLAGQTESFRKYLEAHQTTMDYSTKHQSNEPIEIDDNTLIVHRSNTHSKEVQIVRADTSHHIILTDNEITPRTRQSQEECKATPETTEERNKKNSSKTELEFQRLKSLVTVPYLPPLAPSFDGKPVFTLVLDLDETLIHLECEENKENEDDKEADEDDIYYLIRPGAIRFLNELAKYYEIVIFTAAMPDYADWILDNIDRHRIVSHRLYRQHTTPHEDYAIKDLRNLGRPLERTIIIDNLAENFMHTTPNNGIWVESWYDDMDDTVLELLTPFLKEIVTSGKVADVREVLTNDIKEKIIYRHLEEGKDLPKLEELHVTSLS